MMKHLLVSLVVAALSCAAARAAEEPALIATLRSDADWGAKYEACRELRVVGTEASVAALAPLLRDEKLFEAARDALESMPYSSVDTAFRAALKETDGARRLSVINAIGARRDAGAVEMLAKLLGEGDPEVALAAARALGAIGNEQAATVLAGWRKRVPEGLRLEAGDVSLAAAQRLLEEGNTAAAAAVFTELGGGSPPWPDAVRMGALRGLVLAEPDKAAARLIGELRADDARRRGFAAYLVTQVQDGATIDQLARDMATLPADGKIAFLGALAARKDASVRTVVRQWVQGPEPDVQRAAVEALGVLGGPQEVAVLVPLLDSEDQPLEHAVETALATMRGREVDDAIAGSVAGANPPARAVLLGVLARRGATGSVAVVQKSVTDPQREVRVAALGALAGLGGCEQVRPVIDALLAAGHDDERSAAERALRSIASRCGDGALSDLRAGMARADAGSQAGLLRALSSVGSAGALEAVIQHLRQGDSQVREEVVRVLAAWRSVEAAPMLLDLAKSGDSTGQRILALRGFVRLAGEEPSTDRRAEMLRQAQLLATRPEETRLILGVWAGIHTPQALGAVVSMLDDPAVRSEACQAAVTIAAQLGAEHKDTVAGAMRTVLEVCQEAGVRERAERILSP